MNTSVSMHGVIVALTGLAIILALIGVQLRLGNIADAITVVCLEETS